VATPLTRRPRVEIEYCTQCRWLLRAAWMAPERLSTFEGGIGEVALGRGKGGVFEVRANGQLVWSRGERKRFPEIKELKQLVRDVVAPGRDPRTTRLREIAEPPNATIDSGMPLGEAFAFLEEQDFERVPVVEDGKLVGVLSRSVVQRRLAEDEPPEDDDGH